MSRDLLPVRRQGMRVRCNRTSPRQGPRSIAAAAASAVADAATAADDGSEDARCYRML